jgi:hypothetical protein
VNVRAVAYGYVQLGQADSQRLKELRREITAYCEREGFALELVFADCGVHKATARPGWTALLDHVSRAGASVVMLPATEHLPDDRVLRAEMCCRLAAAAARLAVMSPAPTCGLPQPDGRG